MLLFIRNFWRHVKELFPLKNSGGGWIEKSGGSWLFANPPPRNILQDNADKPSRALIDDALQGLLELAPCIFWHPFELGIQVLAD